jgi:SRSO17 transposase
MHASGELDDGMLGRLRDFVRPLLWRELESHKARELGAEYIEGLLGPAARKTVEPMVRATRGGTPARAHERRMQEMLAQSTWNHRKLTLGGAEQLMRALPDTFAAYTLDDTAILKQGQHSVGVAHQYAGCIGGVTNCQAVVTMGVANEHVSSLIAAQLYLPTSWFADDAAKRRRACDIPLHVQHRTKHEIALALVEDVRDWGLPKLPWLMDSAYGDSVAVRHALDQADETYVAGASLALTMWPIGTTFLEKATQGRRPGPGRPATRLVAEHGQRPVPIERLAMSLPPTAWQTVLWRHGSRGPQRGRFAAVRVRPARGLIRSNSMGTIHPDDLQPEQWLLIHWPQERDRPTKAWLSNLDASTDLVTLVSLARLRWRIERDHEESKQLVGFDHYEGRTWPGLHHHLALVILAEQFLALERARTIPSVPVSTQAASSAPTISVAASSPPEASGPCVSPAPLAPPAALRPIPQLSTAASVAVRPEHTNQDLAVLTRPRASTYAIVEALRAEITRSTCAFCPTCQLPPRPGEISTSAPSSTRRDVNATDHVGSRSSPAENLPRREPRAGAG